jgi:hypothetical protein
LVGNKSKTGRKRGGQNGSAAIELLTKDFKMDVKTSFFDILSEVQKDSQDVSAGIGKFLKNPT